MVKLSLLLGISIAPMTCFGNDINLIGSWSSQCTPLAKRHSVTSVVEFSKNGFQATYTLYADQKCQTLNLKTEYQGKFQQSGNEFDWTPSSVSLVIQSMNVLNLYNSKTMCGFSDWNINDAKDIAGRFCEPNKMPQNGTTYSDHLHLD